MDLDALRSIVTVLAFGAFVGVVAWAYSGRRGRDFEHAASLPLLDDDLDRPASGETEARKQ